MGPNALGMQARCDNPDCDKEPWQLRKHPSEYAGRGPTCPECGSTRVGVVDQETQALDTQEAAAPPADQPETDGDIAARAAMGATKGAYALAGDHSDEQEVALVREAAHDLADTVTGFFRRQKEKKRTAERVELGEPEQAYPQCECGRVFKRIDPDQTSHRCKNCGRKYPIEHPVEEA